MAVDARRVCTYSDRSNSVGVACVRKAAASGKLVRAASTAITTCLHELAALRDIRSQPAQVRAEAAVDGRVASRGPA